MYIVEITEDKVDYVIEHMSRGIQCIGKAVECLEELKEHRSEHRMGGRQMYDDYDDYDYERKRRHGSSPVEDGRGRYSRY